MAPTTLASAPLCEQNFSSALEADKTSSSDAYTC